MHFFIEANLYKSFTLTNGIVKHINKIKLMTWSFLKEKKKQRLSVNRRIKFSITLTRKNRSICVYILRRFYPYGATHHMNLILQSYDWIIPSFHMLSVCLCRYFFNLNFVKRLLNSFKYRLLFRGKNIFLNFCIHFFLPSRIFVEKNCQLHRQYLYSLTNGYLINYILFVFI